MSVFDQKVRLSECVEAIHSRLDSTVTSALSKQGVVRFVWILTRQRPTLPMSSLPRDFYTQWNTKMRSTHEQLCQMEASAMPQMMQCLTGVMELTDEVVS